MILFQKRKRKPNVKDYVTTYHYQQIFGLDSKRQDCEEARRNHVDKEPSKKVELKKILFMQLRYNDSCKIRDSQYIKSRKKVRLKTFTFFF